MVWGIPLVKGSAGSGGAGPVYTPADEVSLQHWWNGDNIVTSGSDITTVTDMAGSNNLTGVVGAYPKTGVSINSNPAVDHSPTEYFTSTLNVASSYGAEIRIVYAGVVNTVTSSTFKYMYDESPFDTGIGSLITNNDGIAILYTGVGGNNDTLLQPQVINAYAAATPFIQIHDYKQNLHRITIITTAGTFTVSDTATDTPMTATTGTFTVGAQQTGGNGMDGAWIDMLIFNDVDFDYSNLVTYLAGRLGL